MPRRLVALVVLVLLLPSSAAAAASLGRATAQTRAAGSARYTIDVTASLSGGRKLTTNARGTIEFSRRRAHIYKLVPGGQVPEEQIVIGPWTYANSNVTAALGDPNAKPWTKLDTRRLAPSHRAGELEAARVLAYLPSGVATPHLIATRNGLAHFQGVVSPARVVRHIPAAQRPELAAILRAEYAARPFRADFWLDTQSRLRRLRVSYGAQGMRFTILGTYSAFGSHVNVKLPPPREITNITPK